MRNIFIACDTSNTKLVKKIIKNDPERPNQGEGGFQPFFLYEKLCFSGWTLLRTNY